MCSHCDLHFSSLEAKLFHGASYKVTEDRIENIREYVQPLQIAARRQRELLSVMAFQEIEWALIDDVD